MPVYDSRKPSWHAPTVHPSTTGWSQHVKRILHLYMMASLVEVGAYCIYCWYTGTLQTAFNFAQEVEMHCEGTHPDHVMSPSTSPAFGEQALSWHGVFQMSEFGRKFCRSHTRFLEQAKWPLVTLWVSLAHSRLFGQPAYILFGFNPFAFSLLDSAKRWSGKMDWNDEHIGLIPQLLADSYYALGIVFVVTVCFAAVLLMRYLLYAPHGRNSEARRYGVQEAHTNRRHMTNRYSHSVPAHTNGPATDISRPSQLTSALSKFPQYVQDKFKETTQPLWSWPSKQVHTTSNQNKTACCYPEEALPGVYTVYKDTVVNHPSTLVYRKGGGSYAADAPCATYSTEL